jgi:Plavaka transposase
MQYLHIFIVLFIMTLTCPYCKTDGFQNARGLAVHRGSCAKAKEKLQLGLSLRKRKNEIAHTKAPKIPRPEYNVAGPSSSRTVAKVQDDSETPVDFFEHPDDAMLGPEFTQFSQQEPINVTAPIAIQAPEAVLLGRGHRKPRLPKKFTDFLPSSATPVSHHQDPEPPQPERHPTPHLETPIVPDEPPPVVEQKPVQTQSNKFGMYRVYPSKPSLDPEEAIGLDDVCDSSGLQPPDSNQPAASPFANSSAEDVPYAPFLNMTVFRLMSWWYGGSGVKSAADLNRLVEDVLLQDDFDQKHLEKFNAARECARLDKQADDQTFSASSGWDECSVKIRLPAEYTSHKSEDEAPEFEVSGVFVRNLVDVVKEAFQDPIALTFHMTPYMHFWKPDNAPAMRLFSELYSSDALLQEHEKICSAPREPGCELETTVAAIMLWSDSTHLANFGNASLWPIYAFFGNQSKYTRAKPTSFASHHIAYIPAVCPQQTMSLPGQRLILFAPVSFQKRLTISIHQCTMVVRHQMSKHIANANLCTQSGRYS